MRLESLTVTNFRGLARRAVVPLDGDIVIVWGVNGTGKTSLLDAFQWLVLGEIPRLKASALRGSEDYVSSRYADGPPSVSAQLDEHGRTVTVTRTGHGKTGRVLVEDDGGILEGESAEAYLRRLIPHQAEGDDDWPLRACLLQQDDMRELLTGDTKKQYELLGDLSGLEQLRDLDERLKSELRALRKAVRDSQGEVRREERALAASERDFHESRALLEQQRAQQMAELDAAASRVRMLTRLPDGLDPGQLLAEGTALHARIDGVCDELAQAMAAADAIRTVADIDVPSVEEELTQVTRQLSEAEEHRLSRNEYLRLAEHRAAVERDRRGRDQQLAALALEHLDDDECPVCGQKHDVDKTRHRLESRLPGVDAAEEARSGVTDAEQALAEASARYSELSMRLASTRERLTAATAAAANLERHEARVRELLDDLTEALPWESEPGRPVQVTATAWLRELEPRLRVLRDAVHYREAQASVRRSVEELNADIDSRRARLEEFRRHADRLTAREARAVDVCRWLGAAIVSITGEVVARSTPLADALFKRFDVHPTFRRFTFAPDRHYESGHLRPWIYDDDRDEDAPATHVLSAAQLNALAVCVFLALNLEQSSAFETLLLDDPVQSMDDINVLSLTDVLRTLRSRRQIVLTTHDVVLAQMLSRKLRPLAPDQRTVLVKLSRWTRQGPSIDIEPRGFDDTVPALELVGAVATS